MSAGKREVLFQNIFFPIEVGLECYGTVHSHVTFVNQSVGYAPQREHASRCQINDAIVEAHIIGMANYLEGGGLCEHDGDCFCHNDQYRKYSKV